MTAAVVRRRACSFARVGSTEYSPRKNGYNGNEEERGAMRLRAFGPMTSPSLLRMSRRPCRSRGPGGDSKAHPTHRGDQ